MRSVMGMLGVALLLALAAVQLSAAEHMTSSSDIVVEYPIPVPDSGPLNIVVESPGRVWFTMSDANMIGSLVVTSTTEYRFTTFAIPTADSVPYDLVFSDGLVWFTENAGNKIGRLDPASGSITEYSIPTANSGPTGIDVAPDGMLWFVERDGNRLGSLDPDTGIITDTYQYSRPDSLLEDVDVENNDSIYFTAPGVDRLVNFQLSRWPTDKAFFDIPAPAGSQLFSVAVANDGYPWVTAPGANWIGRYTPTTMANWRWYPAGTAGSGLGGISVGVIDGLNHTWFSETDSGKVGLLITSPSGTQIRQWEQPLPSINSRPNGVAADSEGHVWVTESVSNMIAEWRPPYYHSIYLPMVFNRYNSSPGTPLFGVQLYGSTGPESKYYTPTVESGASWVRVALAWSSVEPANVPPESYNWASADASLQISLAEGINVIAFHTNAPGWAAEYSNGPINEGNYDDFAEYIGALVERYDGDGQHDAPGSPIVNHWELYNEPDAGNGDQRPDSSYWGHFGAEYAHMLSVAHAAAKGANSDAQIVFGGIAYDWFEDQGGPFVHDFLDDVLAAGGDQHFDIMNLHAYPAFRTTWAERGPGLLEKTEYVRAKLHEYGADKPIIISEAGWHSNDAPIHPGSLEIQARYVVELFTQSMAADVQVMIWWMMYDPGRYYWDNGLITIEGVPKPSYYAFQNIVSELSTAHFQRVLTEGQTGSDDMEAYEFLDRVHDKMTYVAWLDPMDTDQIHSWRLTADQVTTLDIYGNSALIRDADDGVADGRVTILVSGQPVFVEKPL